MVLESEHEVLRPFFLLPVELSFKNSRQERTEGVLIYEILPADRTVEGEVIHSRYSHRRGIQRLSRRDERVHYGREALARARRRRLSNPLCED